MQVSWNSYCSQTRRCLLMPLVLDLFLAVRNFKANHFLKKTSVIFKTSMCVISRRKHGKRKKEKEKKEKVRRIDGGIAMESSIPFQFWSIPFCNSNSNSMACNSNSGIGIGIEVNCNSNSGIDPCPLIIIQLFLEQLLKYVFDIMTSPCNTKLTKYNEKDKF